MRMITFKSYLVGNDIFLGIYWHLNIFNKHGSSHTLLSVKLGFKNKKIIES